ncbi:MAG TPA: helix-turn-helix domain-containing protein [Candidatus Hydrogenedens sp.]|nr:helix-turn-helix domain-containing protein [Candidatus Hydrogenedens sp.]
MDNPTNTSNTINSFELEVFKRQVSNPVFESLFRRTSTILCSATAAHFWELSNIQDILIWSENPFPLCNHVLSNQVGCKKCFSSRFKCAKQVLSLNVPLFFKCHIGFNNASINLLNDKHHNLLLTIGPFSIDGNINVLSSEVTREFKNIGIRTTQNNLSCLESLPQLSLASVKEVLLWTKESFQQEWCRMFGETTTYTPVEKNKIEKIEPLEKDIALLNKYLEQFDRIRAKMFLVAIQTKNKDMMYLILKGKGEELIIHTRNLQKTMFSLYAWVMNVLSSVIIKNIDSELINKKDLLDVKDKIFLKVNSLESGVKRIRKIVFSAINKNFNEKKKERFDLFFSVLEDSLLSDCSLNSVAKQMGLDISTLSHWLKRNFDINFDEFLCYVQVEKIAELLRNTTNSLSRIGSCVGIPYSSLVSEKFKRITGYSPTEYRAYFKK